MIPPLKINKNIYLCDKKFHTELIEQLYESHDYYGIVLISGEELKIYKYQYSNIELIESHSIHRQKKHKKGGQSAHRFMMIGQAQVNEYIKLICQKINKHFICSDGNTINIKGLIIAGVGEIKNHVTASTDLHKNIKLIIKQIINTSDININSIQSNINQITSNVKIDDQLKILNKFYDYQQQNLNMIVYGNDTINKIINDGLIKELIIHESKKEEFENIISIATHNNCIINIISSITSKGSEILTGYGGIVGTLWYPMNSYIGDEIS